MKFLLSLVLLSSAVAAQTSYVAPTKVLAKKAYQLGVGGDFFNTTDRKDQDGDSVDFEDGEKFSRIQGEVQGHYGLTGNLQVGGGARFRQNQSTSLNTTTQENESETSTGVESTFFQLVYAFPAMDRVQYTLEGLFRYRPYTNDETVGTNEGSFVLGDQGNEYSAGLGVTYNFKSNNFLTGRVGYRKPGDELSSEVYWNVEGALAWNYVALVAGVDGVSSMNNDPYKDDPRKANYYTGETSLYNSTNREWIMPYAGLNFALGKKWRIEFRGAQVVSGRSTDLGTVFGVNLITRVNDTKGDKPDSKFKDYDFEVNVTKVSPKKGYVVIDKGIADDVQKGMKIDFFEFDYVGGNILVASGTVISHKAESSIVKITHIYNAKKELKEGLIGRGAFR